MSKTVTQDMKHSVVKVDIFEPNNGCFVSESGWDILQLATLVHNTQYPILHVVVICGFRLSLVQTKTHVRSLLYTVVCPPSQ